MTTAALKASPEQRKVIDHRGGHLQVIACAGAGKTEAISSRVASLIVEGVEPAQIVAFTFTERAAASLKTRITRRVAEAKGTGFLDRLGPMFVGTIHAYCLHMLQDHVPEFAGQPQDWLISKSVFPTEARSRYEGGDAEERRLFYVALTRAKDMLYLSRFHRINRNVGPSPYLLEVAGGDPDVADKLPLPEPFKPPPTEVEQLPTISFSELAAYDDCPMRYRLSSSFGFQPQLVRELGYGKAIHHILRHIAELAKKKNDVPTAAEVEEVFKDQFYLPFASNATFDQLLGQAKGLVNKYLDKYSDDLQRVWQTERPFELHLEQGIVSGRADVILDREGGKINSLALVDYKTANDPKRPEIFDFQLQVYAAAGRGEGLNVEAAYLHHLKPGERQSVEVGATKAKEAQEKVDSLIDGIKQGKFPALAEASKCRGCDVRAVCKHAKGASSHT